MAKSLSKQDVRSYALIGARTRFEALRAEMQSLISAFPELARKGAARATAAAAVVEPKRRGRRKKMSAEERRSVSERMKRYWAARRKEKGK